jgi:phospholipase/carboxylesterase
LGPEALAIVGFSQGAMMSLHVAPRRAKPMAAVVAISGRLIAPEMLGAEVVSRPPVLVMHGDQDAVVPFEEMAAAADALVGAGFDTYGHVMKGMGHGISQDGLGQMLGFLKQYLPG